MMLDSLLNLTKKIYFPFKSNFSNKHGDDVACRTCNVNVFIESQEHILNCDGLNDKLEKGKADISKNVDKQLVIVRVFKKKLRKREILLNTSIKN